MKRLIARAGVRTKILHIYADSIPQKVQFTAQAVSGYDWPEGTVEVVRRRGMFWRKPEFSPLAPEQTLTKRATDIDYAVFVTPAEDVEIAFQTRHFEKHMLFWLLGGLVVIAILSLLLIPLL
jgi:hypothetical protein